MGVFSVATFSNVAIRIGPESGHAREVTAKGRGWAVNEVSLQEIVAPGIVVNRNAMRGLRRGRLLNNRLRRSGRWSRCGLSSRSGCRGICGRRHWRICGQNSLNIRCRCIGWNHHNRRWSTRRRRAIMGIGVIDHSANTTQHEKDNS